MTGRPPRVPDPPPAVAGSARVVAGPPPIVAGSPPDIVDLRRLRQVLRQVPTSLAVVCTMDGSDPVGATIGSFVSISLDPPSVAYFAMRSSRTLNAVRRAGAFSVNVLAEDQAALCEVFARGTADRFRGVRGETGPGRSLHLDGALVVLDCDVDGVVAVRDDEMVVGRMTSVTAQRPASSRRSSCLAVSAGSRAPTRSAWMPSRTRREYARVLVLAHPLPRQPHRPAWAVGMA